MKVNSFEKSFPREGAQIVVWNKKYKKWVIDQAVKSLAGSSRTLMHTSLYDATHWISLPKNPTGKEVKP